MARPFKPPFPVDPAVWENVHLRSAYIAMNAEGAGRGGGLTNSERAWALRELAAGMGLRLCNVDHDQEVGEAFEEFMEDWEGESQQ